MQELQSGDPEQVGPYRLTARLGGGGMGRVFLGWSLGGRLSSDPRYRGVDQGHRLQAAQLLA